MAIWNCLCESVFMFVPAEKQYFLKTAQKPFSYDGIFVII